MDTREATNAELTAMVNMQKTQILALSKKIDELEETVANQPQSNLDHRHNEDGSIYQPRPTARGQKVNGSWILPI